MLLSSPSLSHCRRSCCRAKKTTNTAVEKWSTLHVRSIESISVYLRFYQHNSTLYITERMIIYHAYGVRMLWRLLFWRQAVLKKWLVVLVNTAARES